VATLKKQYYYHAKEVASEDPIILAAEMHALQVGIQLAKEIKVVKIGIDTHT
jgi:hypothetical protein